MTDELEAAVERVTEATAFMEQAGAMLGRGEMPAPATPYAVKWHAAHATLLHALAEANERASLLQTALAASEARRGELEAWRPINLDTPLGEPLWCALRISHNGGPHEWHVHLIVCDDETGEILSDYEQGWALEDYEFWKPAIIPEPPLLNPQQEGSRDHGL